MGYYPNFKATIMRKAEAGVFNFLMTEFHWLTHQMRHQLQGQIQEKSVQATSPPSWSLLSIVDPYTFAEYASGSSYFFSQRHWKRNSTIIKLQCFQPELHVLLAAQKVVHSGGSQK